MKYVLPTQHVLYFGLQAKKDKLDASGDSKAANKNIAEIYNQVLMMLGHEIFDPETSKRVLVDHAFIVAGGEITKAARNWLGNKLDATKRSQILFMDRDDILNLYVVTNLPLPSDALPELTISDDDIPVLELALVFRVHLLDTEGLSQEAWRRDYKPLPPLPASKPFSELDSFAKDS
jgi:hypothetical protein